MNQIAYMCSECGMTVMFFEGFTMACKGWNRHVFTATPDL